MSEQTTEHATEQTASEEREPIFSNVEIREFEAEDVNAGRAIGKMLSILFIYTVIAMSIVSWWTLSQQ